MINGANSVELCLTGNTNNDEVLLPTEIVRLEKSNFTTLSNIPQTSVNYFSNCNFNAVQNHFILTQDISNPNVYTLDTKDTEQSKKNDKMSNELVQVQHIQASSELQSNPGKYFISYNRRAYTDLKAPERIPNNIRNGSAFNDWYEVDMNCPANTNTTDKKFIMNNNNTAMDFKDILTFGTNTINTYTSDIHKSPIHRTEDQENAFRCIEDVHNYAKLDYNCSSNEEDEEEEDLDEVDDDDFVDLETNFESYFNNRLSNANLQVQNHNNFEHKTKVNYAVKKETDIHFNMEPTQDVMNYNSNSTPSPPEHHARRPMNAFLIFCKRHRAIVRERYKSLENRSITKILGDWWASLEENEKKHFTNLAQENKDAFFSANPNFKWYKLPAPSLRSLNTRPTNLGGATEIEREEELTTDFKLADEAQMGDLNALIFNKTKLNNTEVQQTLSHNFINQQENTNEINLKKTQNKWQSFSSNSSEDDVIPKKLTRSCKGKKYQELVNSGQIISFAKKVKSPKSVERWEQNSQESYGYRESFDNKNEMFLSNEILNNKTNNASRRTATECHNSQHFELIAFDLNEKIKKLPMLSLDIYLQRKRSTQKRKKLNAKKRNSNSVSSNKSSTSSTFTSSPPITPTKESRNNFQRHFVGSQKRKARKESITRRDVSAMENEVSSLIPISADFATISECYYFNESTESNSFSFKTIPRTAGTPNIISADENVFNLPASCDDDLPTSDLLILAEVAANRTELRN